VSNGASNMVIKNISIFYCNHLFKLNNSSTKKIVPVAGIIANLIAFTALFKFIDKSVEWFFGMIGLKSFGLTVNEYKIKN